MKPHMPPSFLLRRVFSLDGTAKRSRDTASCRAVESSAVNLDRHARYISRHDFPCARNSTALLTDSSHGLPGPGGRNRLNARRSRSISEPKSRFKNSATRFREAPRSCRDWRKKNGENLSKE